MENAEVLEQTGNKAELSEKDVVNQRVMEGRVEQGIMARRPTRQELESYLDLKYECKVLRALIGELEDEIFVRGNGDISELIEKKEMLVKEWTKRCRTVLNFIFDMERWINEVADEADRPVLRLLYFEGKEWRQAEHESKIYNRYKVGKIFRKYKF